MTATNGKTKGAAAPPRFRVRPLSAADFTALVHYDWSPLAAERDTIYLFLTHAHARYCLAAEDEAGHALGYLVAARSADGKAAFVFHVHVLPAERRRGIGSALVRGLESVAAEDGVETVWFLAREKATRFYSALGYARTDELLHPEALRYVKKVKRTFVMARRLSPREGQDPPAREG